MAATYMGGRRPNVIPSSLKGEEKAGDDILLKRSGKCAKKKTAWLPGGGRHVNEGRNAYEPFTHIVRTLHLEDAVETLDTYRMKPKSVVTFSSLQNWALPNHHPCKKLKVLWFSPRLKSEEDEDPNWYGNVEFAIPCHLILEMFQYCFFVEMVTAPTHTYSKILLTNKDYSSVLPFYNRKQPGGGWLENGQGHYALQKCFRYKNTGTNKFDHTLEFMLEVTAKDERKILSRCKIDFKNHEDAEDTSQSHVCNRSQSTREPCPTPYTSVETAEEFHCELRDRGVKWGKIYPKLTNHAKQCLSEALENDSD